MTEHTETAPAISCNNLTIHAGGVRLLDGVSLAIEAREHVLLVGPSGSGKTTLLRAIAGLLVPSGGEISLFGRKASSESGALIPPEDRATQMLFQGGALWPHLRRRDGRLRPQEAHIPRRSRLQARIGELLEIVDLEGFEKRRAQPVGRRGAATLPREGAWRRASFSWRAAWPLDAPGVRPCWTAWNPRSAVRAHGPPRDSRPSRGRTDRNQDHLDPGRRPDRLRELSCPATPRRGDLLPGPRAGVTTPGIVSYEGAMRVVLGFIVLLLASWFLSALLGTPGVQRHRRRRVDRSPVRECHQPIYDE